MRACAAPAWPCGGSRACKAVGGGGLRRHTRPCIAAGLSRHTALEGGPPRSVDRRLTRPGDEPPTILHALVLQRLRAEWPDQRLILVWDGAPYHRAGAVREAADALQIELVPLPGYSPDLMPVEALWRWLREDVTYHHCHRTAEDLSRRVAAFEARLNQDPCVVADRLSVKDRLNPEEEKLRFSR